MAQEGRRRVINIQTFVLMTHLKPVPPIGHTLLETQGEKTCWYSHRGQCPRDREQRSDKTQHYWPTSMSLYVSICKTGVLIAMTFAWWGCLAIK
jgi:hypothetical protein